MTKYLTTGQGDEEFLTGRLTDIPRQGAVTYHKQPLLAQQNGIHFVLRTRRVNGTDRLPTDLGTLVSQGEEL